MVNDYKNIIVLGNGFDIFLGLPTRWSDFVDFYDAVKEINIIKVIDFNDGSWNFDVFRKEHSKWTIKNINGCISKIYRKKKDEKYRKDIFEFLKKIKECKMLEFCSRIKISESNAWNDFEHLIENILNYIDEYVENIINKPYTVDNSVFMNEELRVLIKCLKYNDKKYFGESITISNINLRTDVESCKEKLLDIYFNELLYFRDCYKQYIDLIIDWMINDIDNGRIINNNRESLILSFNYTQDGIYFNECVDDNVLYVHGKANNNIIIGISNKQRKSDRIRFSKEYIRIYDRAISKNYLANSIYKELEKQNFTHCYIIGHSLDTIDHSLLKLLYSKVLVKTTIFFYSDADRDKKMLNLYKLLQEENMNHLLNDNLLNFVSIDKIWEYNFQD